MELPVGMSDTEVEVIVVVNPINKQQIDRAKWLAFIEETAGSLAHNPIERAPQGEYEIRDEIE